MSGLISCPECGYEKTDVLNVRPKKTNEAGRKRQCPECGYAFRTTETVDGPKPKRHRYEHEKLLKEMDVRIEQLKKKDVREFMVVVCDEMSKKTGYTPLTIRTIYYR